MTETLIEGIHYQRVSNPLDCFIDFDLLQKEIDEEDAYEYMERIKDEQEKGVS